jgi:hypothetical protein
MKPIQAKATGTMRKIVDFHLDGNFDWIAELECGHEQHVRHDRLLPALIGSQRRRDGSNISVRNSTA